ncbi:MAG: hypothetical protein ACW98D_18100 [Promethearchaeota archaeon]|jgi:hypothetical protein
MDSRKKILLFTAVLFILALLFNYILFKITFLSEISFLSITWGALIASINFLLGIITVIYSFNKTDNIFLTFIWGGLLFRLGLMLIGVAISLKFLDLSTDNFIFSVLFFYIFFLISEIVYLNLRKQ